MKWKVLEISLKFLNEVKERILSKLTQAEGFEKFLQDRYLGQKRFSLEGLEAFIPLLDTLASEAKKMVSMKLIWVWLIEVV